MIDHAIDMAVTQAYLEYEQEHLDVKLKDFFLSFGKFSNSAHYGITIITDQRTNCTEGSNV